MTISIFAFIFGISQLILLWNIIYSAKRGEKIGKDPWGGWSLEWSTTSPPPTPSFDIIPTQKDANANHNHDHSTKKIKDRLWTSKTKGDSEEAVS